MYVLHTTDVLFRPAQRSSSTSLSMGFDFGGMLEKMTDPRYARVRHILVEEKGEEGRAKLEAAKEQIAGDLDKFSDIAETMSTCTSAVRVKSSDKGLLCFADCCFGSRLTVSILLRRVYTYRGGSSWDAFSSLREGFVDFASVHNVGANTSVVRIERGCPPSEGVGLVRGRLQIGFPESTAVESLVRFGACRNLAKCVRVYAVLSSQRSLPEAPSETF